MERSTHFSWENPLFLWPCSIAFCIKLPEDTPKIGWTSVVPGWVWNPQFHGFQQHHDRTMGRSHLAAGLHDADDKNQTAARFRSKVSKNWDDPGIWWYLVISGYIWLYLVISGYIWLYLVISGWSMASHPHLQLISRHFLSASPRVPYGSTKDWTISLDKTGCIRNARPVVSYLPLCSSLEDAMHGHHWPCINQKASNVNNCQSICCTYLSETAWNSGHFLGP